MLPDSMYGTFAPFPGHTPGETQADNNGGASGRARLTAIRCAAKALIPLCPSQYVRFLQKAFSMRDLHQLFETLRLGKGDALTKVGQAIVTSPFIIQRGVRSLTGRLN